MPEPVERVLVEHGHRDDCANRRRMPPNERAHVSRDALVISCGPHSRRPQSIPRHVLSARRTVDAFACDPLIYGFRRFTASFANSP
jgi:hypothetical protein